MKDIWKLYPMFCPNCGKINYGYKSEDGRIKYECGKCTVRLVRVQKSRRHDSAAAYKRSFACMARFRDLGASEWAKAENMELLF